MNFFQCPTTSSIKVLYYCHFTFISIPPYCWHICSSFLKHFISFPSTWTSQFICITYSFIATYFFLYCTLQGLLYLIILVFVYGYVACTCISMSCAHSAWRGQKKVSEPVEMIVIPGWVVALECRFSGKAAIVLYHWPIFSNLPFLMLNLAFYNLLVTEEICLILMFPWVICSGSMYSVTLFLSCVLIVVICLN